MEKFKNEIQNTNNFKYIFSSPLKKELPKKIIARKIEESTTYWQIEKYINNQVFHTNLQETELENTLLQHFNDYKQCCILNPEETINVFNNKGKAIIKHIKAKNCYDLTHNKQKNYCINEGDDVPAMRELGIFTNENKIIASKYDKFKQINKFIEIIDDKLKQYTKKEINIIDFGCGKSYLSFVLYHYLTKIKKLNATIRGYDLKADVVKNCNKIAKKYNYDNLLFYNEDIANVKDLNNIDMIITLHACDIATDFALNFAINNNIKYIFSVPCCQHEVNLSIHKGGDYDILLEYGAIKEKFSALLTDTIRAKVLECRGYKVDVIEFIDFEHTPKNLMLRAEKTKNAIASLDNLLKLKKQYGFNHTLLNLQSQ